MSWDERRLFTDHFTRTFRLLDFVEMLRTGEVPETVEDLAELLANLSDCSPTGTAGDYRRATVRQLAYLCHLAGLYFDGTPDSPGGEFMALAQELGVSVTHAGHLIAKLKPEPVAA